MSSAERPRRSGAAAQDLYRFAWVYGALSFLLLRSKLQVTPVWFDGTLERNHAALLAFRYTNNEQSRLLQYAIPEALVRIGLTVAHAYLFQRWLFITIAFIAFHAYLRRWFSKELTFAAVCLLAATLPFTFMNDLQESFAFLMASTIVTLMLIRDASPWLVAFAMLAGAMNNETSLALASVYAMDRFSGWRPAAVWNTLWRTVAVTAPAAAYTAWIRYVTWDRPHLGGARHWRDNVHGIIAEVKLNPFDYPRASYLSIVFVFNVLWIFAVLGLKEKPKFVRTALVLVPVFLGAHLLTGIISEVRQMAPLGFVVIPAALCWMFRDDPWNASTSR